MALKLNGSTDGSVSIDAPADTSPAGTDVTLTLPTSAGSSGEVLTTNGSGTLSWGPNVPDAIDVNASAPADSVVIDSSGRVGIGTTTPGNYDTAGDNLVVYSTGETGITIASGTSSNGNIYFADGTTGNELYRGWIVYSHNVDAMRVGITGTERTRIGSDGTLLNFSAGNGIVSGNSAAAGTSSELFLGIHSRTSTTGGGTTSFRVWTNGNVQNTNNSYTAISDIKLKENIIDAKSQWDDIKGLRVVNYNFKAETGAETFKQLGLIAQEVEQVCPGLVGETVDRDAEGNDLGTTTKNVNYSILYMKAVGALQEAMERIETLETANASLEARLTALEGGAS